MSYFEEAKRATDPQTVMSLALLALVEELQRIRRVPLVVNFGSATHEDVERLVEMIREISSSEKASP